jgi:hypothetical protein
MARKYSSKKTRGKRQTRRVKATKTNKMNGGTIDVVINNKDDFNNKIKPNKKTVISYEIIEKPEKLVTTSDKDRIIKNINKIDNDTSIIEILELGIRDIITGEIISQKAYTYDGLKDTKQLLTGTKPQVLKLLGPDSNQSDTNQIKPQILQILDANQSEPNPNKQKLVQAWKIGQSISLIPNTPLTQPIIDKFKYYLDATSQSVILTVEQLIAKLIEHTQFFDKYKLIIKYKSSIW